MEQGGRRYSDRELRSILGLAIDIDRRNKDDAGLSTGLSASEVESIAQDIGIGSEVIRRAIGEYERQRSDRIARVLLGEPIQLVEELTVDRSLTAEEVLAHLARPARMRMGLSVSVTPQGGQSRIRVTDRPYGPAGGIFGGLVGGLGIGAGLGVGLGVGIAVLGSPLFIAVVPLGFIAFSYALARRIYRVVVRARRRFVRELIDRVRESVASAH
ncbi:MAG TPA: hypothetical protein VL354_00110 [Spirochaetia bacterium]|nr:hypothetical protein [Spirochaetia bacterium]